MIALALEVTVTETNSVSLIYVPTNIELTMMTRGVDKWRAFGPRKTAASFSLHLNIFWGSPSLPQPHKGSRILIDTDDDEHAEEQQHEHGFGPPDVAQDLLSGE